MENVLLVYATVMGIVISMMALYAVRRDESLSRKWSRVRVRVDDNPRRHIAEPQEEEVENEAPLQWLLLGGMFLFIILLVNAV